MKSTSNHTHQQMPGRDDGATSNEIAVIREQTFESLQILKNLLSLLLPKEDDDGPKLVDLIAALVAQQRDIATGITRLQSDMNALFDRLDGGSGKPGKLDGPDSRRQ